MSEERGPSWYDVSVALEQFWEEYNVAAVLGLARPIKRVDGRGYTTWGVSITVAPVVGGKARPRTFWRYWGKGGAHATAPAALYWALWDARAHLDELRATAEAQAAF